jgi:hypothetical protein
MIETIAATFIGGWLVCMVVSIPIVVAEDEKLFTSMALWLISPILLGFLLLNVKHLTEKD